MNLQEWSEKTGILPTPATTEKRAVSVLVDPIKETEIRKALWHLDDYIVSSACGVVIWLVPRRTNLTTN